MKTVIDFVRTTLTGGLLIILPVVVIVVLIRHGVAAIHPLLEPVMSRLPDDIPFPRLIALTLESLVVILGCFAVGLSVRTPIGRRLARTVEASVFEKVPGYALLRSITRRAAGEEEDIRYKVALVEIEGGLAPSFIIEEHPDGRYTVFVPDVPTPTSGSIYIFPRELVHIVDVSFGQAIRCMTKLGAGSEDLLQAMRRS
ncbi:DUF502 domain-containing protein [Sulfuricaulis sp.]|jgi:uncharacterized membrane protein|uniref:DUF502 domain-containing protein n=1 Tax=Sulfuricaulis sp. TaxID=2003553 RepID=UPI0035595DCA